MMRAALAALVVSASACTALLAAYPAQCAADSECATGETCTDGRCTAMTASSSGSNSSASTSSSSSSSSSGGSSSSSSSSSASSTSGAFPPAALLGDPSATADELGYAVALTDTFLLAGAPGAAGAGLDEAGAVHVFDYHNQLIWQFYQRLDPPPAATALRGRFGESVAVDGVVAAVGSPGNATVDGGRVHIYRHNGSNWAYSTSLGCPAPCLGARFGAAVALHGNTLAVAAPRWDPDGMTSDSGGAVFVFEYSGTTWSAPAQLVSATPRGGGEFGGALALDADTLVVGAPGEWSPELTTSPVGKAHVYRRATSWNVESTLYARGVDVESGDRFGAAVALLTNEVVVGAPGMAAGSAASAGAVFVFPRSAGEPAPTETLRGSPPQDEWNFGHAVAATETGLYIGEPLVSRADATNTGRVYVYTRSGTGQPWSYAATRTVVDPALPNDFGFALAASTGRLAVGMPSARNSTRAGAVFVTP